MDIKVSKYIAQLELSPHPEGGWYRETYRSDETARAEQLPARYGGDRSFSTAIYFLVPGDTFSAFHRIQSDEVWHHYDGDMLEVYVIDAHCHLSIIRLGKDIDRGETPQAVVRHGDWFASRCAVREGYALVGCTVSPGFDFADFEMAGRKALSVAFPQHAAVIAELTR